MSRDIHVLLSVALVTWSQLGRQARFAKQHKNFISNLTKDRHDGCSSGFFRDLPIIFLIFGPWIGLLRDIGRYLQGGPGMIGRRWMGMKPWDPEKLGLGVSYGMGYSWNHGRWMKLWNLGSLSTNHGLVNLEFGGIRNHSHGFTVKNRHSTIEKKDKIMEIFPTKIVDNGWRWSLGTRG